jgi:hypothetical protein
MRFRLRPPEQAEEFESLMSEDRDIVRGSLDTMSNWRLTRPTDTPGQSTEDADYVLMAEIVDLDRWAPQATENVQRLASALDHLVTTHKMLVLRPMP